MITGARIGTERGELLAAVKQGAELAERFSEDKLRLCYTLV